MIPLTLSLSHWERVPEGQVRVDNKTPRTFGAFLCRVSSRFFELLSVPNTNVPALASAGIISVNVGQQGEHWAQGYHCVG